MPLSIQRTALLYVLLLITVILTLWAGLNPKSFKNKNNLIWKDSFVEFEQNGIAYTDEFLNQEILDELNQRGFIIELKLSPSPIKGNAVKFILEITAQPPAQPLIIWQWQDSIIAMNGNDFRHTLKKPRVSARLYLGTNNIKLISGKKTSLMLNGKLVDNLKNTSLKLPTYFPNSINTKPPSNSRIVLGNSEQRQNSWRGSIMELSISPFPTEHGPKVGINEKIVHYILQGKNKEIVENLSSFNYPLYTPVNPENLKNISFDPKWTIFNANINAMVDITLNLLGFIPLGYLLAALFLNFKMNPYKGFITTTTLGFLFSFIIEYTQSWIPSRYSSMQDLVINIAGTCVGYIAFMLITKLTTNQRVNKT